VTYAELGNGIPVCIQQF